MAIHSPQPVKNSLYWNTIPTRYITFYGVNYIHVTNIKSISSSMTKKVLKTDYSSEFSKSKGHNSGQNHQTGQNSNLIFTLS